MTNTNDSDQEQRMIGKQIMIVDIFHVENDREQRGGFSYVMMDDLVRWSGMTEDEIWLIRNACSLLDRVHLAEDAAKQIAKSGLLDHIKGIRSFAFYVDFKLGLSFVIESLDDKADELCRSEYENIYNKYLEFNQNLSNTNSFDERMRDPIVLRQILDGYVRYFITAVEDVSSEGFDWDVIKEMLPLGLSRVLFLELCRKAKRRA